MKSVSALLASLGALALSLNVVAQQPEAFLESLEPWIDAGEGLSDSLFDVIYHEGRFLAVSEEGQLLLSDDGLQWEAVEIGIASYAIAAGDDGLMAVGAQWDEEAEDTVAVAARSVDGYEWTLESLELAGDVFQGVAYGMDTWVVVGRAGSVARKPAGGSWEVLDSFPAVEFGGVAYGEGSFIAVTFGSKLYRSTNGGSDWSDISQPGFVFGLSVNYEAGVFAISGNTILTSADGGASWTQAVGLGSVLISSVSYDGSRYFAIGNETVSGITSRYNYASTDGEHWARVTAEGSVQRNAVALGAGRALIVGSDGYIRASARYAGGYVYDPNSLPAVKMLAPDEGNALCVEVISRTDDSEPPLLVQHSADLEQWETDTLAFDAESGAWSLESDALQLQSAVEQEDNLWILTLCLQDPADALFVRLDAANSGE